MGWPFEGGEFPGSPARLPGYEGAGIPSGSGSRGVRGVFPGSQEKIGWESVRSPLLPLSAASRNFLVGYPAKLPELPDSPETLRVLLDRARGVLRDSPGTPRVSSRPLSGTL